MTDFKQKWKDYVESYKEDSLKKMHLLSVTHVVNSLLDEQKKEIMGILEDWCMANGMIGAKWSQLKIQLESKT